MILKGNFELFVVKNILLIIKVCLILALSAVTFTFFVLLIESLIANFQLAISIAIIVQILFVILNQSKMIGILSYPLSHTDISNQIMNNQSFALVLIQSIVEMVVVTVIGFYATKKRFENLMECA